MKKILSILPLLFLVACSHNGGDIQTPSDPALKGIWKMVSVRCDGGNIRSDVGTIYAVIDPEINDDIFIPYTPNLTVGQARGHIIILEEAKHMKYQCISYGIDQDGKIHDSNWLRATFIEGWPDNRMGYATFYTYKKADSLLKNAYVQSYYEMKLNDKTTIATKEDAIRSLAAKVTSYNLDPSHTNIFGFSAMNANTGEPTSLKTYAFAHEYNGYAFEVYVENMKAARASAAQPFRCGVVPMDHYGADVFTNNSKVKLYGDKLSWAVIESNFYN